ncbi:uncharacterized protein LOC144950402 [Lampetra fluviatilis]
MFACGLTLVLSGATFLTFLHAGSCEATNVTAAAGTRAVLPCRITPWPRDGTIEMAKWFHSGSHGAQLVLNFVRGFTSEDGRSALRGQLGEGDVSLHVERLKLQDAGHYRCQTMIGSVEETRRRQRRVFVCNVMLAVTPDEGEALATDATAELTTRIAASGDGGQSGSWCVLVLLVPAAMFVGLTVALVVWRCRVNRRNAAKGGKVGSATAPAIGGRAPSAMNYDRGIYEQMEWDVARMSPETAVSQTEAT